MSTVDDAPSIKIPEIRPRKQRTRQEIAEEGGRVLREAAAVARATGARSTARRTAQAYRAAAQTSLDLLQELRLGEPAVPAAAAAPSSSGWAPPTSSWASSWPPAPRSSPSEIRRIIAEEIGNPDSKFASIDPKPLASASVAQVHAATLKTGERVVLKVQKPGVADILKADLGFLYVTSRVLELLSPELGRVALADIAGDIRTSMLDELDFTKEAANIAEFRDFLVREGLKAWRGRAAGVPRAERAARAVHGAVRRRAPDGPGQHPPVLVPAGEDADRR
eukprot:CAMPEP_0194597148 /NCGR_PEP_ID=MMETSP0292-20121207/26135_1 /TAXON_ID=39354 /ORGANISM="Heterosigma akashiwo, Strain CCMP2393" /LENGTH=278 /DNA_ID=CAMNT_0039457651 /DNA_START=101 /DNA_END=933 /DNA_ORIENTATION=-